MFDLPELQLRIQTTLSSGEILARSNFRELQLIGSGSFSRVYKVESVSTGKQYALKLLSVKYLSSMSLMDQLKNELRALSRCDHENIIKLYAAWEADGLIMILQELAEISLYEKMSREGSFSEAAACEIMADIVKAVIYLHSLTPPILHRDLKPENVLLLNGKAKLADFGWSNTEDGYRNTYCGTFDYLAPEMIKGTGHGEKLDVWTLGVLLYEMLEGTPPFAPKDRVGDKRIMAKLTERNILTGKIEFETELSAEASQAIRRMVTVDEASRPTAKEILDLPFFKKAKENQSAQFVNSITISASGNNLQTSVGIESPESMSLKVLESKLSTAQMKISLLENEQKKFSEERTKFAVFEKDKQNEIFLLKSELQEKSETCNELIKLLRNIGDAVSECSNRLSPARKTSNREFSANKIKEDLSYIYFKIGQINQDKRFSQTSSQNNTILTGSPLIVTNQTPNQSLQQLPVNTSFNNLPSIQTPSVQFSNSVFSNANFPKPTPQNQKSSIVGFETPSVLFQDTPITKFLKKLNSRQNSCSKPNVSEDSANNANAVKFVELNSQRGA